MSLKIENKERLEALRASLNRITAERGRMNLGSPAKALLMCKEEDTRLRIFEAELAVKRHETCETCDGVEFVEAPQGNHSASPLRVPCPDCRG